MTEPFFIFLITAILGYVILYFVIKLAVKNAIMESHGDGEKHAGGFRDTDLPQKTCPKCGQEHDFDCPICPYCGYVY